eukprot:GDKJ01012733.1.p1 GENE.GDKJ01012733.1~~GDKJ01012733.1.p1  ORF type:complete len:1171 (-),score=285.95 GDKJ01012733.1:230-3580(-)
MSQGTNAAAMVIACNGLRDILLAQWNSIDDSVKADTKQFLLSFLFEKAQFQHDADVAKVLRAYIRLLNLIVKQQWFDGPSFQDITKVVEQAMEANQATWLIGLKIFVDLVEVMQPELNNLSRSRRIAVSFREVALKDIFIRVYSLLKQLASGAQQLSSSQDIEMLMMLLKVANQTLSFDFLGTMPEDTTDETATVMLPSSWDIMKETEMPFVFFELYKLASSLNSELSAMYSVQFLIYLAALRRSYFSNEEERAKLTKALLEITTSIIKDPRGDSNAVPWRRWPKVYHELCKLLSKINNSNKLRELTEFSIFHEWVDAVFKMTSQALPMWHQQPHSQHYLILFWSAFVAPVSYAIDLDVTALKAALVRISVEFVQGQIQLANAIGDDEISLDDDPMSDETTRSVQMEALVTFSRHQLLPIAEVLGSSFDSAALEVSQGRATGGVIKRITWLLYAIGAIVGAHSSSVGSSSCSSMMSLTVNDFEGCSSHQSSSNADGKKGDELPLHVVLAKLCRPVLVFIHALDSVESNRCDEQFELGVLSFLENLRKVHIGELSNAASNSSASSSSLSYHRLNTISSPSSSPNFTSSNQHQPHEETVTSLLGLPPNTTLLDIIVEKFIRNISRACTTEAVGKATIAALFNMCNGVSIVNAAKYSTMRVVVAHDLMLQTETIKLLLGNHQSANLQFLHNPKNSKYRTRFYHALGRLIFSKMRSNTPEEKADFVLFMRPFEEAITAIQRRTITDEAVVRRTIINLMRDLRGISMAALVHEHYNTLFDWLVNTPNKPDSCRLAIVNSAINVYWSDHEVCVPLLKFMCELTQQKGSGRIVFPQNSMNGLVLFRHVSHCLSVFGKNTAERSVFRDVYREKYKPTAVALEMFVNAHAGDYVNTGVFQWYGDQSLSQSILLGLKLALEIPNIDLNTYGVALRPVYQFIQTIAKTQCKFFFQLPYTHLRRVVPLLEEGFMSFDSNTKTQACSALAAFCSFAFKESRPPQPNDPLKDEEDEEIQKTCLNFLNTEHQTLKKTLFTLLHMCLFESNHSNWSLSRPMLPLILLFPDELNHVMESIKQKQTTPAVQAVVEETFKELMQGISNDLSDKNSDAFTKNLYLFSTGLKSRITQ